MSREDTRQTMIKGKTRHHLIIRCCYLRYVLTKGLCLGDTANGYCGVLFAAIGTALQYHWLLLPTTYWNWKFVRAERRAECCR